VAFFLTALGEEALSRGLLIRALLPRGKWEAVLILAIYLMVRTPVAATIDGQPVG
jgi:membrane protease YdiL (CAAX protease family)